MKLNQNLVDIVELLNDGQYHDGTSIGNQLHITRAAVWKAIKKLEQYDVPLTAMKSKGYQLTSPLILFNAQHIQSCLKHKTLQVDILEKIDSTNDYLKQFTPLNKKVIACLAETQTKGKARLNRTWHSPFAENIYLSIIYPFDKDISELSGLSLVVGLAICHAIEATLHLKNNVLKVKWPNDVLFDGCKLAGTLIEIQAESHGFSEVIIGIGINVNMKQAIKQEITQPWTSLLEKTNTYIDRNDLAAKLIDTLIDYLEKFSKENLSGFIDEWQNRDHLANAEVKLMSGSTCWQGIASGINNQGHLQVKTKDNKMLSFSSGDATLVKALSNNMVSH